MLLLFFLPRHNYQKHLFLIMFFWGFFLEFLISETERTFWDTGNQPELSGAAEFRHSVIILSC